MRSLVGCSPNARPELLPEAGARDERTLEAVSSRPLFGAGLARALGMGTAPLGSWLPTPRPAPPPGVGLAQGIYFV